MNVTETAQNYGIPALIALGVTLLLQLLKSNRIPVTIPPRWRPWVAMLLAMVGTVAAGVAQGLPIGQALAQGLGSGLTSIGLFEAAATVTPTPTPAEKLKTSVERGETSLEELYETMKDVKPSRGPGIGPTIAGGMLFALVAFGCAGLPPEAAKGVEDISRGVSRADEGSRELYAFALSLCPDDACQAKLERLADPVIDGFQAIRIAWCAIKPDAEGCDATDGAK
jgi:hypothetical protein